MSALPAIIRRHKAAITRARNAGDMHAVIRVCDRAAEDFDLFGWPDNWHHFNIARQDAVFALARKGIAAPPSDPFNPYN